MAATSSPNRAKSADRIEGAIRTRCGMGSTYQHRAAIERARPARAGALIEPCQPSRVESVHSALLGEMARQGPEIAVRCDQPLQTGEFGRIDGFAAHRRAPGHQARDARGPLCRLE